MDENDVSGQYLTFHMDEYFAINVQYVLEVLEYSRITIIPKTPDFMSGVINNRGMVVPIINLRKKFGMPNNEITPNTCFIIIEILHLGEKLVIGVMVDEVQEVIRLDSGQIEPPPNIGMSMDKQFIQGLGKTDDAFIIILDIEKILTSEEINEINMINDKAESLTVEEV